jgi:hypothetical protein
MTMERVATILPWHTSRTRSFTRSQDLSLLSIARLNKASSRVRFWICKRTRIAQISFSFRGAFCPTSFHLTDVTGRYRATQLGNFGAHKRARAVAKRLSYTTGHSGKFRRQYQPWRPLTASQSDVSTPLCDGARTARSQPSRIPLAKWRMVVGRQARPRCR